MAYDWNLFFGDVFSRVKKNLKGKYRLEEDGSGPRAIVEYNKLLGGLPCYVKVLEIKVPNDKVAGVQDEPIQWIFFDLERLGELTIEEKQVDWGQDDEVCTFLTDTLIFDRRKAKEFLSEYKKDPRTSAAFERNKILVLTRYDIKNEKDNFIEELTFNFDLEAIACLDGTNKNLLVPEIEYKTPTERIIPLDEILREAKRNSRHNIEELQKNVSEIGLIDSVPQSVKRTFENAKALYIFGYFHYNFFTISRHYAYLALEAAIKQRYFMNLPNDIEISNKKGAKKIKVSDFDGIIRFGRENGYGTHFKLNGMPFPHSKEMLCEWLRENGIVSRYEEKRCLWGLESRNRFSHLTSPSIWNPSTEPLIDVANLINKIYDSKDE